MNILEAIILGIIQGLTEFLPVSSSGHLVLAQQIMGIELDNLLFFDLMLHLGTLGAVIGVWYKEIWNLFKKPYKDLGLLLLASVPAAIVLVILGSKADELFADGKYLCFTFLATAVILFVTEYIVKRRAAKAAEQGGSVGEIKTAVKEIDVKGAAVIGLAQAVAVLPGLSRSGSTISAALIYGADKDKAARFSFLMSIVVIAGGAVIQLYKVIKEGTLGSVGVGNVLAGMLAAAVVGYLSIKFFIKLIGKLNFKYFSLYLTALSIFTFINYFVTPIW